MPTDDVIDYDEVRCPHCRRFIKKDEVFPVPRPHTLEFGSPEEMEEFFKPSKPVEPRKITYWMDHRVDVELPGGMKRVEAATRAIKFVREYMKTLPEGYRLRQACPKHIIDSDGEYTRSHWVVRCVLFRKTNTMDLEWASLLDQPEEGEQF